VADRAFAEDAAHMGLTDGRRLRAVDPVCALCNTQVTIIQGAPARQKVKAGTTLYRPFAWCRLEPCGHTFTARSGALIH
jgi:hypothetical protein